ncbi:MerR family transcriptional regulator [Actinosynnema sp. NPDC050436]|uniref:MerR family transcriptional regulator n=1 Tax=Actinosynnema sp. NPDC050436 TaxID=3155659 RepID=UPI0033F69B73
MHWRAGAVARVLGVSPVTLRTWDRRYGLGPSTREEGRHRRYSDQDVARLRVMVQLTGRGVSPASAAAIALDRAPAPDNGSAPDLGGAAGTGGAADPSETADPGGSREPDDGVDEARGFAQAASRLDSSLMSALAAALVRRRGVVGAWEGVFAPYLIALGERVAESGSGVEVEHLASAAIAGALRTDPVANDPVAVEGRLPALLACAPEEQHSLPLDALAAALAERRCATRNLGARVPAGALLDAVNLLSPRVVVLWAHANRYARLTPVAELLERGVAVTLGGAGWTSVPEGARLLGSLSEAVDAVRELNRF